MPYIVESLITRYIIFLKITNQFNKDFIVCYKPGLKFIKLRFIGFIHKAIGKVWLEVATQTKLFVQILLYGLLKKVNVNTKRITYVNSKKDQ